MLDLVDEATLCLEPVAPCLLPHDFVVGTDLDLHTNADKLLGVGMGELLHLTSEDRVVGRLCEQGVEEPVADVLVGLGEPLHEVGGDLGLGLVDGVLQQLLGEVLQLALGAGDEQDPGLVQLLAEEATLQGHQSRPSL